MKSFCATCCRPTNHKVLKEEKVSSADETGWWDESKYQIIQCLGCDTISFRKLYNDVSYQSGFDEDMTTQELFPKRGPHSRPIKSYRNLPVEIKKVYQETIDAYNNELPLLASVGIRAVLEAICVEKKVEGGTYVNKNGKAIKSKKLDGKIYGLLEKGLLTPNNAELLHELRFLGNAAIHELTTPGLSKISLALDIIELVIENIYIARRKAHQLRSSRESK
ncbi:MAG: DUF4145 domain-containing protein [Bacteroidota bacterium]